MSSSQKTATKQAVPEPPASAVALDAHWAAKRERLRQRQAATAVLRVCDDDDLKATRDEAARARRMTHAQLENETTEAGRERAQKALDAAEQALTGAEQAVDDATITLTFRGLPRREYEALIKAHPPTEEQAEDGDAWNTETFAPALVAASSVDGMTTEDAEFFLAEWSAAEARRLYDAAMGVQQTNRLDLGKG